VTVRALAAGFAAAARRHGLPVNTRFAGFSAFDTAASYQAEISTEIARGNLSEAGLAVVMCHPGFADAALAALDPVVERRQQEHDALMQLSDLPDLIWHPVRRADGSIDWPAQGALAPQGLHA
jgi:chitin disaccharide deacetylase